MKRSQLSLIPAVAFVVLMGLMPQARAVTVSASNEANGEGGSITASATDQANQSQSTFLALAQTSGSELFGSDRNKLNDGTLYNASAPSITAETFTPSDGSVIRITFDTTVNLLGYNIVQIDTITGSGNGQLRSGQAYAVEYSLVGSGLFTALATVGGEANNINAAFTEVKTSITSGTLLPLASGVDELRFTFSNNVDGLASMYREIDVTATATIPEPSSMLLMTFAALVFVAVRRRK